MASTGQFWLIETRSEYDVVQRLLLRRYPILFQALTDALETTDPMDVVYPGNPNEYDDVVQEALVIIAGLDVAHKRSHVDVEAILRRAIALCFGDDPDAERVEQAAQVLSTISFDR